MLVFQWVVVQNQAAKFSQIFTVFAGTIMAGLVIDLTAAYLFGLMLRHHIIPDKIKNFAKLEVVGFGFGI